MNRFYQQGVSAPSRLVIIIILGFILMVFLKISPMYYENFQLRAALEATAQDRSVDFHSSPKVWKALQRNLVVQGVTSVTRDHVSIVSQDSITTITVDYQMQRSFLGNLTIGTQFSETVSIQQ